MFDLRGCVSDNANSNASPVARALGDDEDDEDEEEFGGQETLMTRAGRAEAEFSRQETLVIREDQGVSGWGGGVGGGGM